jgi:hypothetical protein
MWRGAFRMRRHQWRISDDEWTLFHQAGRHQVCYALYSYVLVGWSV